VTASIAAATRPDGTLAPAPGGFDGRQALVEGLHWYAHNRRERSSLLGGGASRRAGLAAQRQRQPHDKDIRTQVGDDAGEYLPVAGSVAAPLDNGVRRRQHSVRVTHGHPDPPFAEVDSD
jgi:hypothetical protein